ncbi:hypothetical protein E4U54_007127 [Claviceps lovelessii]|nr:hypothetical protein E4U54_007127 [Claviceps lovelessii]
MWFRPGDGLFGGGVRMERRGLSTLRNTRMAHEMLSSPGSHHGIMVVNGRRPLLTTSRGNDQPAATSDAGIMTAAGATH